MRIAYLVFGIVLCLLAGYGNYSGSSIMGLFSAGKWGQRGHSAYHK